MYPTLTSSGIITNAYQDLDIDYAEGYTNKLYKIDDGAWQPYEDRSIRITYNQTLYAKGTNGDGTKISETSYQFPSEIITPNVFDNDLNTYHYDTVDYVYHCISLDSSVWGKKILIKVNNYWNTSFYFLDSDGNKVSFEYNGTVAQEHMISNGNQNVIVEITIPEGAVKFGHFNGYTYIYEIQYIGIKST